MATRKCACGGRRTSSKEVYHYTECGLDNIYVAGITVNTCTSCGKHGISIPAMGPLHRAIAMSLAKQPHRLAPEEIKFLRKYLGLSNRDFAKVMGVSESQASRWASGGDNMSGPAEHLLRLLVERMEPIDEYPTEWLKTISSEAPSKPQKRSFRRRANRWEMSVTENAAR